MSDSTDYYFLYLNYQGHGNVATWESWKSIQLTAMKGISGNIF
jgi:hypothetical protein